MTEVTSGQLRNETRAILDRVRAGKRIVITVDGRPVAELAPLGTRDRWMGRDAFVRLLRGRQSDAGLTKDLYELAPEFTGDLPAL